MENRRELKLAIEGMHCGACVRRVTAALARLEGVEIRGVDIGAAAVDYDLARVQPQEVLDAVNAIGFAAREG
jgi:copper chaperone